MAKTMRIIPITVTKVVVEKIIQLAPPIVKTTASTPKITKYNSFIAPPRFFAADISLTSFVLNNTIKY